MSNAPQILGDSEIIQRVFEGNFLMIYSSDDSTAVFIKNYINTAVNNALKYHYENGLVYERNFDAYKKEFDKWMSKGMNGSKPKYIPKHYLGDSINYVTYKVNHYRNKFWYWEKLRE